MWGGKRFANICCYIVTEVGSNQTMFLFRFLLLCLFAVLLILLLFFLSMIFGLYLGL